MGGCCPGPWAPGGLAQSPGVPESLADSEGVGLGPWQPPTAPDSAAAEEEGPAVPGRSSDWQAVTGCPSPLQHRCARRRQQARHGGPRWRLGTRTTQGLHGSVAPLSTAVGSSGCLWEEPVGKQVCPKLRGAAPWEPWAEIHWGGGETLKRFRMG